VKVALLGIAVALVATGIVAPPEDSDWTWLDGARKAAFESLMPVVPTPDLVVTYFSYRDLHYGELETYFTIRLAPDSVPVAQVVQPVGASMQKQLLDMHRKNRAATIADLVSRVSVRRTRLSAGSCAAIRRSIEAMLRLTPPVPETDILVIHPRVHRILQVRDGQAIDLSFVNDYHLLVRWAARSLDDLGHCVAAE
jgi:hypothetical protein